MKFTFALLAGLACLASASVQAQALATGVPASAARAASSPIGISREKASEVCTTAPRSEWFSEEEMKLLAQHRGYRIKTFKIANNSCYEIYGFDREGRIVEVYFNPVTARLVRQNTAR